MIGGKGKTLNEVFKRGQILIMRAAKCSTICNTISINLPIVILKIETVPWKQSIYSATVNMGYCTL